jgi:drug/metabolite transporter (DMT)-like permease
MSFVPVISAIISWVVLGETLEPLDISGMVLTVGGVAAVVSRKRTDHNGRAWAYPLRGIWLAFGGAAGQAIGFVLSKHGMGAYDAFAANQIRLIAGLVGFVIIFSVTGWWPKLFQALGHRSGIVFTSIGGFFGPFLGISLSLYAVQHTQVGVAATIIALVPVLIIPPSILIKKEAVTLREIIGALVAVSGSALLFR